MKDVHAMAPATGRLTLRRVGVSGIRKPLHVQRPEKVVELTASFEVSVDLPASRKGSDLSRNAQLLAEIVDETATRPVPSLEAACSTIAKELLLRHTYARQAEAVATAEYFLRRGIADDRRSLENFALVARAQSRRANGNSDLEVVRSFGAEAVGMTACPCAMETCREKLSSEYPLLRDPQLADLPMITHNQRNRTFLSFTFHDSSEVEADDVIEAIELAQSSPTYAILKRGDEAQLVLDAHRKPRFVEDVVRELLSSLPGRFPHLSDTTEVEVRTRSEESIHKYDVIADHRTTLGELRQSAAP